LAYSGEWYKLTIVITPVARADLANFRLTAARHQAIGQEKSNFRISGGISAPPNSREAG
jgi:uncharacterized protein YaeQ